MSQNLSAHYALACDIDASGVNFTPIGYLNNVFTGTFDGRGHVIRNLTISASCSGSGNFYFGLFHRVGTTGVVKNLGVENANISVSHSGNYSGFTAGIIVGFIGTAGGLVENCYSTGTVVAVHDNGVYVGATAGGLVGVNYKGTVSRSYSTASVTATANLSYNHASAHAGGLVGIGVYDAKIINSYSIGFVSGNYQVGGLVGFVTNGASIENCYSTGVVSGGTTRGGLVAENYNNNGTVSNSFWDVQTSGQTSSAGGTGLTTAQMKTLSTYLNAGWDIALASSYSGQTWFIDENVDYPRLGWEFPVPKLFGTVTDRSGAPIGNARVAVGSAEAYTNESGCYEVTVTAYRSHAVSVSKEGYVTHENCVYVGGADLRYDVVLERVQRSIQLQLPVPPNPAVASASMELVATEPPSVTVEVSPSPPSAAAPAADAIQYLRIEPSRSIVAKVRITLSRSALEGIDPDSVTVLHWEGYWRPLPTRRVGEFTYEFESGFSWFAVTGWPSSRYLSVTVTPPGGGSVSPGSGSYAYGSHVTLRATPAPGYVFMGWSGDAHSFSDQLTLVVTRDTCLTASFAPVTEAPPDAGRTVYPDPVVLITLAGIYAVCVEIMYIAKKLVEK